MVTESKATAGEAVSPSQCAVCGREPSAATARTCDNCVRIRKTKRQREYKARIRAADPGLKCRTCGRTFPRPARGGVPKDCPDCRSARNKRTLPSEVACVKCGSPILLRPHQAAKKYCDSCRVIAVAATSERRAPSRAKASGPKTPILTCQKCGREFERKQFGKNPKYCPEHRDPSDRNRAPRTYEKGRFRKWAMPARYGITLDERTSMLERQGGKCLICGAVETDDDRLNVDHDHRCCVSSTQTCGACVRGLLCGRCNRSIGLVNDDLEVLRSLMKYIKAGGVPGAPNRRRRQPTQP